MGAVDEPERQARDGVAHRVGGDRVAIPAGRNAVLTFALPEDEDAFSDALNGERWRAMVWELDQSLRSIVKHNDDDVLRGHAGWARAALWAAIRDAGLAEVFDR